MKVRKDLSNDKKVALLTLEVKSGTSDTVIQISFYLNKQKIGQLQRELSSLVNEMRE